VVEVHEMESVLRDKSYKFAVRTVNLCKFLCAEKKEYVLSKQILRSGTAIGALVREAEYGQSKLDFVNKLSIALKEANETDYWLMLLRDTNYITSESFESIHPEITEIIKLLTASIKTAKKTAKRQS
jgi:four helix bundle protein